LSPQVLVQNFVELALEFSLFVADKHYWNPEAQWSEHWQYFWKQQQVALAERPILVMQFEMLMRFYLEA
jgi:hypothetical protein